MNEIEQAFYDNFMTKYSQLGAEGVSAVYKKVTAYLSNPRNTRYVDLYLKIQDKIDKDRGIRVDEFFESLKHYVSMVEGASSAEEKEKILSIKRELVNHHLCHHAVDFFARQKPFKAKRKLLEWLNGQSPAWLAKQRVEGGVMKYDAFTSSWILRYRKRKESPLNAKLTSLNVTKLNNRKEVPLMSVVVDLPKGVSTPSEGDVVGLFPRNPDYIVERIKQVLKHQEGEAIRQYAFKKAAPSEKTFAPEDHDSEKRYSYEDALKHLCTNRASEAFIRRLRDRLVEQGYNNRHPLFSKLDQFVKLADSSHISAFNFLIKTNIVDILEAFPNILTLDELMEDQGKEHRRIYTISKINYDEQLSPTSIELTVSSYSGYKTATHSFTTSTPITSSFDYKGASITFLEDGLKNNKKIETEIFIQPRTFGNTVKAAIEKAKKGRLSEAEKEILKKPLTMVVAGSGLSGARAILHERKILKEKFGLEIGVAELVFGIRNQKTDAIYQGDLEDFIRGGVLEKVDYVESRTSTNKKKRDHKIRYVQDFIRRKWDEKKVCDIKNNDRSLMLCGDQVMGDEVLNAIAYKHNHVEQVDFDFTDALEGWQVGAQNASLIASASGSRFILPYKLKDVINVKVSTPHWRFNPLHHSGSHTVYRKYFHDKRDRPSILMNVSSALGISKLVHMTRNVDGIDEIASFFNQIKGILGASLATGVFTAGAPFVGFGALGMSGEVLESEEEKLKLRYAKKETRDLVEKIAKEYGYGFSTKAQASEAKFIAEAKQILGNVLKRAKSSAVEQKRVSKVIDAFTAKLSDYTQQVVLHRALKFDHRAAQFAGFPAMFLMFGGMLSGLSESATKIAYESGRGGLDKAVSHFNIATTSIFAPANLLMAVYAAIRFKSGLLYDEVMKRDAAAVKHFMRGSSSLKSLEKMMSNQRNLIRRSYQHYGAATALFQSLLASSGMISLASIGGAAVGVVAAPALAGVGATGAILAVAHRIRADHREEILNGDESKTLDAIQWVTDGNINDGDKIDGRYLFDVFYSKIGFSDGYKDRRDFAATLEKEYKVAENDLVHMKTMSLMLKVLRNRYSILSKKDYNRLSAEQHYVQFERRVLQRWNKVSNFFRSLMFMRSRTTLDMSPELAARLRSQENIEKHKAVFHSDNPFTLLLNAACQNKLSNEKGQFDIGKIETVIRALDQQCVLEDKYKKRGLVSGMYKKFFPDHYRQYFARSSEKNYNELVNRTIKHVSKYSVKQHGADKYFINVENKKHFLTGKSYQERTGFNINQFFFDAHLPENTWQREAYAAAALPFVVDYLKNSAKVHRADALEHITQLANENAMEKTAEIVQKHSLTDKTLISKSADMSNKWQIKMGSKEKQQERQESWAKKIVPDTRLSPLPPHI